MVRPSRARYLLVTVILVALAGCGGAAQDTVDGAKANKGKTEDTVTVRIGLDSFPLATVVYAAQMQGYFGKQNIQAQISNYSVGADTLNAALAGQVDFGFAFDFGTLRAMQSNNLRYVSRVMTEAPGWHVFAVREDIKEPSDLRGKRLGIVQGSQQQYITIKYLRDNDVPVESVRLDTFGTPFELVAALRTGKIDGTWVFGPAKDEATKADGIRVMTDDGAVLEGGVRGFLISTRQMTEDNPEVVARVLKALIEGENWLNADEGNKKLLAAYTAKHLKISVAAAAAIIEQVEPTVAVDQADVEQLTSMAEFLVAEITPDKKLNSIREYFDVKPLTAADPERVKL